MSTEASGAIWKALQVAMMELHTLGLLKFRDDDTFCITEKGIEKARGIVLSKLTQQERILVMLGSIEFADETFEGVE